MQHSILTYYVCATRYNSVVEFGYCINVFKKYFKTLGSMIISVWVIRWFYPFTLRNQYTRSSVSLLLHIIREKLCFLKKEINLFLALYFIKQFFLTRIKSCLKIIHVSFRSQRCSDTFQNAISLQRQTFILNLCVKIFIYCSFCSF